MIFNFFVIKTRSAINLLKRKFIKVFKRLKLTLKTPRILFRINIKNSRCSFTQATEKKKISVSITLKYKLLGIL